MNPRTGKTGGRRVENPCRRGLGNQFEAGRAKELASEQAEEGYGCRAGIRVQASNKSARNARGERTESQTR